MYQRTRKTCIERSQRRRRRATRQGRRAALGVTAAAREPFTLVHQYRLKGLHSSELPVLSRSLVCRRLQRVAGRGSPARDCALTGVRAVGPREPVPPYKGNERRQKRISSNLVSLRDHHRARLDSTALAPARACIMYQSRASPTVCARRQLMAKLIIINTYHHGLPVSITWPNRSQRLRYQRRWSGGRKSVRRESRVFPSRQKKRREETFKFGASGRGAQNKY